MSSRERFFARENRTWGAPESAKSVRAAARNSVATMRSKLSSARSTAILMSAYSESLSSGDVPDCVSFGETRPLMSFPGYVTSTTSIVTVSLSPS